MVNKNDKAYKYIKEEILSGNISADIPLSESVLTKRLKISRTPIRTALQRLQLEGFIRIIPNQGIIVREVSIKEATELYELRQIVEEYLINKAIKFLTEEDFIQLEEYVKQQEQAYNQGDYHRYLNLDTEMHIFCYHHYENDYMKNIIINYRERLYKTRFQSCKKAGRIQRSLEEHRNIIEALKKGDVKLVIEMLQVHLNRGIMDNIANHLTEKE